MPNISISQFKNRFLKNGLSSPAKYHVVINVPEMDNGVPYGPGLDSSTMIMQPEAINLPGRTFKTFEDEIYGPSRQVPTRETYEPVVMTFPVDDQFSERSFFENWMSRILHPTTKQSSYPGPGSGAFATMDIFPLAHDEEPSAQFTLNEVYPMSVIPINMGFGMMNDYTRLQVVFAYRDYVYHDGAGKGSWFAQSTHQTIIPFKPVGSALYDGREDSIALAISNNLVKYPRPYSTKK